jgi:hypothetical protein
MEKRISYIKAPITNKTPKDVVSVSDIARAVKQNKYYKKITQEYRDLLQNPNADDEERRRRKATLFDYVTMSGTFKYRANDQLIRHSGYLCMDIDYIKDEKEVDQIKETLSNDQILDPVLIFTSPSGLGLKCVVSIKMDASLDPVVQHTDYFEALKAYMLAAYEIEIDKACKDVARACFICYDSKRYFNEDAGTLTNDFIDDWKENIDIDPYSNSINMSASSPWDAYNQARKGAELLEKHGYTFVKEDDKGLKYLRPNYTGSSEYSIIIFRDSGLLHVHSDNCDPLPSGAISPAKAFCLLEAGGDWSLAADKLKALGYKGMDNQDVDGALRKMLPGDTPYFWDLVKSKEGMKVKINSPMYLEFLQEVLQIKRIRLKGTDHSEFVCNKGNILEPIDFKDDVSLMVKHWLDKNIKPYNEKFYSLIFKEFVSFHRTQEALGLKDLIEIVQPKLLQEDENTCYLYLSNGFLKITPDEHSFHEYEELQSYIWREQIIENPYMGEIVYYKSTFYRFVLKVCDDNKKRKEALMKAIGYLAHSYKNPANPKAVIFVDEELSEDLSAARGGTGKSIVGEALSHIKKTTVMDGKQIDFTNKFTFERVKHGDKIIFIDDIEKSFEFEDLYVILSNDMIIQRKYAREASIPFEESPKLCLSTNVAIKGNDPSHTRRQLIVEFAPFFSKRKITVQDYFNGERIFGSKWDETKWTMFYNFIIECIQLYMRDGLSEVIVNYKKKQVLQEIGPEMYEWLQENIETDKFYRTRDILDGKESTCGFEGFRRMYPDYKISSRWLPVRLEAWAKYRGYDFRKARNGSVRGYRFVDPNVVSQEDMPDKI